MAPGSFRRPRFLESVPDAPDVAPLRLARAPAPAHPAPPPPSSASAAAPSARATAALRDEVAAPPAPVADERTIRRDALARVTSAVETLRAQSAHLGEQARADALEIGFAVARAILATEIRQNPEALFALVRAAVRRAGESRRIVVRVCPDDLATLQAGSGCMAPDSPAAARVELVADRSLGCGDCLVEADFGRIDGRLETRLAELRRAAESADSEPREGAA